MVIVLTKQDNRTNIPNHWEVTMEIQSSDSIATTTRTTSISIGASRVGKTHFIGTACDVQRVFVLDAENGLQSIVGKKFDFYTVNTWDETQQVLNWFMTEGYSKYDMIAVDSINRIQAYLVDKIKTEKDEHGKNAGMMTINKWGMVAAYLKKVVDVLTKQCPVSVHMNVTAMESKDEVTGATMLYPALGGAFKHEILGYFDSILYHRAGLEGTEQKYWIQLGADSRIIAGTRIQKLKEQFGTVMPNDYANIYNAIRS